MSNGKKIQYKYDEDVILTDLHEYIDSTYDDWELMINAPEQKQIAGIENNTIEFNRVFDYRDIPYENNFGFAYYKHRVEKRFAHVGNP